MKRTFYVLAGFTSLAIGLVGIILPLVPTTPFLLLAGFCFARSSQRFELWLKQTKIYQFYVADYAESKAIAPQRKKRILVQIYLLMTISIVLAPIIWVKVFLLGLTLFITYYLFKVIPDKEE